MFSTKDLSENNIILTEFLKKLKKKIRKKKVELIFHLNSSLLRCRDIDSE